MAKNAKSWKALVGGSSCFYHVMHNSHTNSPFLFCDMFTRSLSFMYQYVPFVILGDKICKMIDDKLSEHIAAGGNYLLP